MDEKKEQVKPLALSHVEHGDGSPSSEFTSPRDKKCIKCCGCFAAILLILLMILLTLMLTVFQVKDPIVKVDFVKIDGLDLLNYNTTFPRQRGGLKLKLVADVSIKNPNVAAFKFDQTRANVSYDGDVVGEVMCPTGEVRARRTLRTDVTVDVMVYKIVKTRRFKSDWSNRVLLLNMATKIIGKLEIGDIVRKDINMKMNCSMNVNLSSQSVEVTFCRHRVC